MEEDIAIIILHTNGTKNIIYEKKPAKKRDNSNNSYYYRGICFDVYIHKSC